ncbi:MAG: hypothetical protein GF334_11225 [Candidatus Altiarchaeales archaeon]|nr:hypothetical protein [Candidatus Altiarchaeales archaeon]
MNIFNAELWDKQEIRLTTLQQNLHFTAYAAACLLAPFLLGHPQFLVGAAVNAALVLAGLNLKTKKILPIVLLPSLGVLARGLIFGPFTVFLVYLMPFIWVGNLILVGAFKKLHLNLKVNKIVTLGIGAAAKAGFLYASALMLSQLQIIPKALTIAMGPIQLSTALVGGALALLIQKRLA